MINIESLLLKESALNKSSDFRLKKSDLNKCAVIVEPREHKMLEATIRNILPRLNWNLHVFCGSKNYEYVKNLLPDWEYKITNLEVNDLNTDQYNDLLRGEYFWNEIEEEDILLFQTDSCIFNGFDIGQFSNFDFIGAAYHWDPHRREDGSLVEERLAPPGYDFNMNGGFSFRKKSSMLKCIKEVSVEDILQWRKENGASIEFMKEPWHKVLPEDVFFHNALAKLKGDLPTFGESLEFCHQHCHIPPAEEKCFAIHAYDKYCGSYEELVFCRGHQGKKPILLIYAGYGHEPFNGAEYSGKKGVRGSEIGLINLAENFTSTYDVYVCGAAIKEGAHGNVTYFGAEKIDMFLEEANVSVLLVNRYIHFFIDHKNTAAKTFVWVQDVGLGPHWQSVEMPHGGKWFIHNMLDKVDGFVCLSDPHIEEFSRYYDNIPKDKIFKIGNGINTEMFEREVEKVPNRFIYSSLPERGLTILLDWFPEIRSKLPDAELHVFTDLDISGMNETVSEEDLRKKIDDTEGVILRGKVPYGTMVEEFLKADVLLYPNIFFETFCTSALEAQAAGCIVVTRRFGALEEVVADRGILINGDPYTDDFRNEAISKMVDILQNKEKKKKLQKKAKEWAFQKTWENRSHEWIEIFQ